MLSYLQSAFSSQEFDELITRRAKLVDVETWQGARKGCATVVLRSF